ncbi:hypothetical protein I4U23_027875 [Adineta vaga]|nr:hypothetical protein I4U23_027875 [Adineta vaga]
MSPKGKKVVLEKKTCDEQHEIRLPSERETALRTKLEQKVKDLTELKMRVKKAEEQHKWLDKEARRLQIETSEYKQFILRKKNIRETQMITLSDYHREEIENINQSKDTMIEKSQQRKEELRLQFIEKSQLLLKAQHELEEMDGYKIIRDQRREEIKHLEQAVKQMRADHVHEIDRFKLDFRNECEDNRIYENIKLEEFEKQAKQEAEQYLYDQTISIQNENTGLRKKIRNILKQQQELNKLRKKLEEEQLYLIGRLKIVTDLKKIRLDKASVNIPKKSSKSILYH